MEASPTPPPTSRMILRQRILLVLISTILLTSRALTYRAYALPRSSSSSHSYSYSSSRHADTGRAVRNVWTSSWLAPWRTSRIERGRSVKVGEMDARYPGLRYRISGLRERCEVERAFFLEEYGRANIRLTRTYTGSLFRINRFIARSLLSSSSSSSSTPLIDRPPVISVLGGSVTGGFGVSKQEIWFERFVGWFDRLLGVREDGSGSESESVNGAVPATGSDYFSFCSHLHIPLDSTLIFIELSINDEYLPEHAENMENLLRSLLDLPGRPAVVMVQALELNSASMANGGDVHLPLAVYYDVPVLNQRNALGPHFMRHPDLIHPFFSTNYWQDADLRHINVRGHRDLGAMAQSLFADAACELVEGQDEERVIERIAGYAESLDKEEAVGDETGIAEDTTDLQGEMGKQVRPWGPWKKPHDEDGTERTWRGVWGPEKSMGQIPRLRFSQRWHESRVNVPLQPQCFSTRSETHPLTPTRADGWFSWASPERPDKTYLFANVTGSTFDYDIETRMGTVKMYSLRSKTFGLGSVWCWVDEDEDQGVRADGWWENGDANIGRFTTIRTGLEPGRHTVHCRLLEETLDPGGGQEFRIISLMSL